jgi:hypothetical protein
LPVGALLALRLAWGWEAGHALAKTRSELRARGVRLDPPTVETPDEENAAIALIEAVKAIRLEPQERRLMYRGDSGEEWITNLSWPDRLGAECMDIAWTQEHQIEVRGILSRNADAFRRTKVAASRKTVRWPTTVAGLFRGQDHPIYHTRQLAVLLRDAALVAHQDGNDGSALENVTLIMQLARIDDQDRANISHLYANDLIALASLTIERIEADLRLKSSDGSLERAKELLALLQNTVAKNDARAQAWEAEIGRASYSEEEFREQFPGSLGWLIHPLLDDVERRSILGLAQDVPSVRADDWQTAKGLVPPSVFHLFFMRTSFLEEMTLSGQTEAGSSYMHSLDHFRAMSDCCAAALLLGARIFGAESGRLPAKADELVPGVLERLPIDPFSADHEAMRYRLDPTGPTVWSVYDNGKDDGASVRFDAGGRIARFGWSTDPKKNPLDIVYGAAWRDGAPAPRAVPSTTNR